jgi:hypothetical protein
MFRVPYRATIPAYEPGTLTPKDRRGSVALDPPCRLDQGRTIGQSPAKPGSSGRLAMLLESNNTLNVSRACLGESLAYEPGALTRTDRRAPVDLRPLRPESS